MAFSLQRELDELAEFVVGTPAEAEGFEQSGVVGEAGTDARWLV